MKRPRRKKTFVIVPAYNEEKHVKSVVRSIKKYCSNIVLVDDGSHDDTSKIASKEDIILVTLPINMGKGWAMKKGIEYAIKKGAQKIITIDCDGQHNPAHIPKFEKLLDKYAVVIGVRTIATNPIPFIRKFGNIVASYLISIIYNIKLRDILCGYRAFKREAYKKLEWQSKTYGVETEMVARIGRSKLKYTELEIENIYLDQFKGVSMLEALEVFLSIPTFKISK